MKKRISDAITCIKKHKKHERKGWYYYNDALFDFVFIPHDFRNGDIVTCLYGDWDTTRYNEKIGIILGYFDDNYRCYKKMAGDYSDTQMCVDIKFDGVNYQGEFEHEHINPMYIERMNLHKNDERMPYLNYLALVYKEKYDYDASGDGSPEYARLHRSLTIYKDDRYEVMIDFYDKDPGTDSIVVIFGQKEMSDSSEVSNVIFRKVRHTVKPLYPLFSSESSYKDYLKEFHRQGGVTFRDEVVFGKSLAKVLTMPPVTAEGPSPAIDKYLIQRLIDESPNGWMHPFTVEQMLDAAGINRVRQAVALNEDEVNTVYNGVTAISEPEVQKMPSTVYTMKGIRLQQPRHGLNIINGKVVLK